MTDPEYFKVVLKLFNLSGLKTNSNLFHKYFSLLFLIPISFITYVMVLINFKYNNRNINEISDDFEAMSTYCQLFIRKFTTMFFHKKIEQIIEDRKHFWNYEIADENFVNEMKQKINGSRKLMKVFWTISLSCLVAIVFTPIFDRKKNLPMACWIPQDNKFAFYFVYISESFFLGEMIALAGPNDAFFLFLCTELEIQLRLISKYLERIRFGANQSDKHQKKCLNRLINCSTHHRFLLKVHNNLSTIFAVNFIIQFMISIIGTTMQFYVLSYNYTDLTQAVRCLLYIMTDLMVGLVNFFPPNNIEIEAENLANQIYSVDWYNSPNNYIKKFILFFLMKTQQPMDMNAGGLMRVNRNVFLQIPKVSFSICSLLR